MDWKARPRATCAALLAAAFAIAAPPRAEAGDYVSCPGVDHVEAELRDASASGYFIPGLKLIILNKTMLDPAAMAVKKFIMAHECAHADPAVGEDESAADCAAARRGRAEGWIGKPELIQICVHLGHLIPDEKHPPGAARCANIRRCMAEAPVEEASATPQTPAPVMPLAAGGHEPDLTPLTRTARMSD